MPLFNGMECWYSPSTGKTISAALRAAGKRRELAVQWLKELLPEPASRESFLLMDSTHVRGIAGFIDLPFFGSASWGIRWGCWTSPR